MPRPARMLHRPLDHGQRLQAEEVELHQAGLLDPLHVELGGGQCRSAGRGRAARARSAAGRRSRRRRRGSRRCGRGPRAAARLRAAGATDSSSSRIACRRGSISIACARVTGLAGLLGTILARRSTWPSGSRSTRPTSRSTARACRLPKVMIWATRSRPYSLLDVGDHLLAPLLAEVDVEVGHRHPLGVEEALEQQAAAQRVEVGDGQRPGDQRAGAGAAAGPDRDAVRLGPFDEVRDDQEVAGEAHLGDHADLVLQPRPVAARGSRRRRPSRPCGAPGPRAAWRGQSRPRSGRRRPSGETRQDRVALSAMKAQRRAMSRVLSQASGRSANSARMSAAGLNQCSGVTRRRSLLADEGPSAMQSSASCASCMSGVGEIDVVGGDQRQRRA